MEQNKLTFHNIFHFLKNYPGCLFFKDEAGRYLYSSDVCNYLNRREEGWEIIGKNELEVQKDPELGRQYFAEDRLLLREGGTCKSYSEFKTENGIFYYEINKSAVKDDTGKIIGIIGTVIDCTKEIELQKQVEKQYVTDPVTGIYNQRYLDQWLQGDNFVYPFTLIACDCNFLKHINDTFGHEYGDQLLKQTGELFLENLPEKCIPIRVGGDEFLILCNDTLEEEAESLIDSLKEKSKTKLTKGISLSIAYGHHTIREGESTFAQCRSIADSKMYCAKKSMKRAYFKGAGKNDPIYNAEMFRSLIGQMPVVLFFKDSECRYQYISTYDENNLKDKETTCSGIGLTDIELQRDEALGREYYEDDLQILATGKGSILTKAIPINGSLKYYQIVKSAVRDEEGKIIGIAGMVTDITATLLDLTSIYVEKNSQ